MRKNQLKFGAIICGIIIVAPSASWLYIHFFRSDIEEILADKFGFVLSDDEGGPPSLPVPASPQEVNSQPSDASALGGYNVLIADRGNNRIIEITPDKKIVWEYQFKNLPLGDGADDAFFADNGRTIVANLENYNIIEQIDFQTQQFVWQYGTAGKHGSKSGFLNSPDDAYKLPNGDIIVADIKNCRILEISLDKKIVRQYGTTLHCSNKGAYLNKPNGDTPLPNGYVLLSNIVGHSLVELDDQWKQVFSMNLPLKYPSDPQPTKAGNILIAEYMNPGKIIEISKQGNVVWEYDGEASTTLNKPSLAIELPNGNILSNDDFNHRVIVIDKKTKRIVWQYGVTGKPGDGTVQLNIPDGVDIISTASSTELLVSMAVPAIPTLGTSTPVLTPATIGAVTRHAGAYVGKVILLHGYVLKKETGYVIMSDEPGGSISSYDLPVSGAGEDIMQVGSTYLIQGIFLSKGLLSSNESKNHLELSVFPVKE